MKYKILKIDKNLNGIIKKDNELFQVPFTLVDEEIIIKKLNTKEKVISNFEIIKQSPDRKNPFCSYFTKCGGCKAQHFKDDIYVKTKLQNVKNILHFHKISFKDITFLHHLNNPFKHRQRAIISCKNARAGFKRYKSNQIIEINSCPLLSDNINLFIKVFKNILVKNFHHLKINEIIITDIKGKLDVLIKANNSIDISVINALQDIFKEDFIASIYWQEGKKEEMPLIIKENIYLDDYNQNILFPSGSFIQAEKWGEETIHNLILQILLTSSINRQKIQINLVDLFCGLGSYMFMLNMNKDRFISDINLMQGYDSSLGAINSINKINKGIKAEVRDLFKDPLKSQELNQYNILIINPPRKGAKNQINEIINSNIKDIIMIYCNVATLGRDLKILLNSGRFKLEKIFIIDQFIFSSQVEIVISLTSNNLQLKK